MDEQRQFIEMVLGDQVGNAIIGMLDRPGPKGRLNRFWDFKYPEQLEQIVEFVDSHSTSDVYLSPLVYGDERAPAEEGRDPSTGRLRRTPENALTSQSIYQDSDTCEVHNFRLRPSIHLTSSTGRYQDFWILTEPIPAQTAAEISHRVAIAHRDHGSDPSSWSANKLLRIPGTSNSKHGFPEDVLAEFTGEVYSDMDISGAYDDIELVERPIIRLPADVSYESEQDLPDYSSALDKLPEGFNLELLTKEHPEGSDRSRMRYRLLCELFRAGTLGFEDVLSLAWHAPVSRKWKEDPRNIRGLIAEALKAQTEVSYESGEGILPPDEEEKPTLDEGFPKLITDEERDAIAGDSNWMRRWDEWCQHKLGRAYNAPYVRMHGVSILSAAFSDLVYVPRENGAEGCNIYAMGIGDSGTGKSSSKKLWRTVLSEVFGEDKSWNIGANASPNALHEKLLERDRKVTMFNADEAHGWFKQIIGNTWTDGILEILAEFYDGYVPPILRTGNRELSGKSAETYFLMHLMGTLKGEMSITNVLDRSMFLSGFLARFIWYIGESRVMTRDSMEETQSNGEYITMGYEPMARQWAAEFANTHRVMRDRAKKHKVGMMMDRDALARLSRAKWQIVEMYRNHPQWDLLDPSIIRIGNNIRRLATLLAAEEATETVSLRHTLLAIECAEEWLAGLVMMTEKISDSEWKRLCDEVFAAIASKGGKVRREAVNRRFASRKPRDLQEQIDALISQGLVGEIMEDRSKWLVIKT